MEILIVGKESISAVFYEHKKKLFLLKTHVFSHTT